MVSARSSAGFCDGLIDPSVVRGRSFKLIAMTHAMASLTSSAVWGGFKGERNEYGPVRDVPYEVELHDEWLTMQRRYLPEESMIQLGELSDAGPVELNETS